MRIRLRCLNPVVVNGQIFGKLANQSPFKIVCVCLKNGFNKNLGWFTKMHLRELLYV